MTAQSASHAASSSAQQKSGFHGLLRNATWVIVSEGCYVLSMLTIKLSLAIFFARIVVRRWHLILIYVSLAICMVSSISAIFYCFFRCGTNLDEYAIQQLVNNCTPRHFDLFMAYQQANVVFKAAFSTLTDLVFVAMPLLVLWNANMDRRTKFSVGAILCMATLYGLANPAVGFSLTLRSGTVCSIVRFRYIEGLLDISNFFSSVINISTWSTIEAAACIVAGCIATLRPLLKSAIGRAHESLAPSGYIAQLSKTIKSSQRSHARSTGDIGLSEIDPNHCSPNRGPSPQLKNAPTYVEYIARPGSAVVPLSSDIGNKRASTDFILERPEPKYEDMS
ncbi:hypothetical protein TW65_07209 [Stemphylium lycopersici]|nr:hypothetical protein TW65_07209 [Stemphylium lycopersici]